MVKCFSRDLRDFRGISGEGIYGNVHGELVAFHLRDTWDDLLWLCGWTLILSYLCLGCVRVQGLLPID